MLSGRAGSLHLAGAHDDAHGRPAARQDLAHVVKHGARQAGADADGPGPRRQRPFAAAVEQALRGQLRLERLEPQGEVAEAGRLEGVDVQLVDALRLEHVDPTMGDEPDPGARLERDHHPVVAEDHAAELGAFVLEREVAVAGGADADLADFALDPQVAQADGARSASLMCRVTSATVRIRGPGAAAGRPRAGGDEVIEGEPRVVAGSGHRPSVGGVGWRGGSRG